MSKERIRSEQKMMNNRENSWIKKICSLKILTQLINHWLGDRMFIFSWDMGNLPKKVEYLSALHNVILNLEYWGQLDLRLACSFRSDSEGCIDIPAQTVKEGTSWGSMQWQNKQTRCDLSLWKIVQNLRIKPKS
jgi:hypothetical protein